MRKARKTDVRLLLNNLTPSQIQMLVGYDTLLTFEKTGRDGVYPVNVNQIIDGKAHRNPAHVHVLYQGNRIIAEVVYD